MLHRLHFNRYFGKMQWLLSPVGFFYKTLAFTIDQRQHVPNNHVLLKKMAVADSLFINI